MATDPKKDRDDQELSQEQAEEVAAGRSVKDELTGDRLKAIAAARKAGELSADQLRQLAAAGKAGELSEAQLNQLAAGRKIDAIPDDKLRALMND